MNISLSESDHAEFSALAKERGQTPEDCLNERIRDALDRELQFVLETIDEPINHITTNRRWSLKTQEQNPTG